MQIPKYELRPYLDMIYRRKWWIIIPFFLVLAGGWIYLENAPKTYRASTLILVDAQRVPPDFVRSTVTEDVQARLRTISQQIHSRSNLESVIQRYELYPHLDESSNSILKNIRQKFYEISGLGEASAEAEPKTPSMQQLVRYVRNKIEISVRGENRAFEISFEWSNPDTAANVANALASQFINQNLRVREEMAIGTTTFLDTEVQRLQRELQQREAELEDYKRRNMGRLPGQLQSNLNILSQLKEELGRVEEQAQNLYHEIQITRRLRASMGDVREEGGLAQQIRALEEQLKQLSIRYTEQHPEIRLLKRRLEQLKEEESLMLATISNPEDMLDTSPDNVQDERHKIEMEQMQRRLAGYESKIQELRSQIGVYEDRVEKTSEVELELRNLERDYNAVNDRFQNLLRRKLDAQLAEQLERRQQGEQFRVVDQAIPPDSPYSPDRNRIMLMTLALALGMGGGMAFLRESIDSGFNSSAEVEQALQPRMLISLPLVKKSRNGWLKKYGGKS